MVAWGQCLVSPDSKSFTQYGGQLVLLFGICGKHMEAISATTNVISSGKVSEDISDNTQQPLSCNSHRCQYRINAQAMVITSMKKELNHALKDNRKLKEMFDPDWMVNVLSKVVRNMSIKEGFKNNQVTQYQGNSSYIGRLRWPQYAHGADGTLKTVVTCYYYQGKDHMKDNCICLNRKIVYDLQRQESAMAAKSSKGNHNKPHIPKNQRLLRLKTSLEAIQLVVQSGLMKIPIQVLMSYYCHYEPEQLYTGRV